MADEKLADTSPMTFTWKGKEWRCRRVSLTKDFSALRQYLRRERVDAMRDVPFLSPDALGSALAKPVTDEEVWDFRWSDMGLAMLFHKCVSDLNKSFLVADAEEMVLRKDPFIQAWQEASLLRTISPNLSERSTMDSSEKQD